MPRSGTSLLTNLLQGLGIQLGEKLAAADANNTAGYWEQEEICQTQEGLLQQLGRRWIDDLGTLPLPSGWLEIPQVKPFKERLISIVEGELSKHTGLWGFKDPRTSRLLPLWKEIFAQLRIDPIYLLAVRKPANAVESLVKLSKISPAHAEMLWLLHNLDAVRDAGDQLGLVVDYDLWFTQPVEQARAILSALGLKWSRSDDELLAGVRERIRPDLHHCRAPLPPSLPFLTETYDLLRSAAKLGRIPDELHRVEKSARNAFALCQPWALLATELLRPEGPGSFSFIDHLSDGAFESLGQHAAAEAWDVRYGRTTHRAIFLHPPGRLRFKVAGGGAARLSFAVSIHPDAWTKPSAGGCQFKITVNGTTTASMSVNPAQVPSDQQWRECALDIPESPSGSHEIVFETCALGNFPWAIWREPRLTWKSLPVKDAQPSAVLDKERAEQCLAEADAAHARNDLNSACAALARGLSFDPDAVPILTCLGNIKFQQGAFGEAQNAFKRASELRPLDTDLLVRLANAAARCGNAVLCEEATGRALELNPENPNALRLAINHSLEKGNFIQGAELCCILLRANPDDVLLLLQLGKCLREIQDTVSARWCYRRAIEVDPSCKIARETLKRLEEPPGVGSRCFELETCGSAVPA
jgi:Flp pilus assembly protein TadD